MFSKLQKKNENDKIYWTRNLDEMESIWFTFDKEHFFNLKEYPKCLTEEQKEIFDRENPDYAKFYLEHYRPKI